MLKAACAGPPHPMPNVMKIVKVASYPAGKRCWIRDARKNGSGCCGVARTRDSNSTAINVDLRDGSAGTMRVRIDLAVRIFRLMVFNDILNYGRISRCPNK